MTPIRPTKLEIAGFGLLVDIFERISNNFKNFMEIKFEEYIKNRIEFYKILKNVQIAEIQYSSKIHLENSTFKNINTEFAYFLERRNQMEILTTKENTEFKEKLISAFPNFEEIENCKNPSVYWFKIKHLEKSTNKKLLEKFIKIRNPKKGWWSKSTKDLENITEYLYLGKVEKNLFDR